MGLKLWGSLASLLAKAAPSLPHHSSIGSLSLPMTIFLELLISLTNYRSVTEKITNIGPREISCAPNNRHLYLMETYIVLKG